MIRRATKNDSAAFLDLLVGLAKFEHLEPPDPAAERRILRDVFEKKRANLFLAMMGKRHVGYALYFYAYSSFLARPTLYLEDIFVLEEARGKGFGLALFRACVREALKRGCGRMEWSVLTWNKDAMTFYESLGAKRLDEWYFYRLTSDAMVRIVSKSEPGLAPPSTG